MKPCLNCSGVGCVGDDLCPACEGSGCDGCVRLQAVIDGIAGAWCAREYYEADDDGSYAPGAVLVEWRAKKIDALLAGAGRRP